jgi:hypothetical protein
MAARRPIVFMSQPLFPNSLFLYRCPVFELQFAGFPVPAPAPWNRASMWRRSQE